LNCQLYRPKQQQQQQPINMTTTTTATTTTTRMITNQIVSNKPNRKREKYWRNTECISTIL